MILKEILTGTGNWLRSHRLVPFAAYQPSINDQGLLDIDFEEPIQHEYGSGDTAGDGVVVKTVQSVDKREPIEKLQDGFNKLIEQLDDINGHLARHVEQQEQLTARIEQLPKLLENVPATLDDQKRLAQELLEQLKAGAERDGQFVETVGQIPTETARQTEALLNIDDHLAAAADADTQLTRNFNKFSTTLDRLNANTACQNDSITQMNKTFAASDRYLKYVLSKQNKRFMWLLLSSLGVCATLVLILSGIIIMLNR